MGHTIAEKILARASGRQSVSPGEIVWATPDIASMPDFSAAERLQMVRDVGLSTIWDPEKLVISVDHRVLCNSDREAGFVRKTRDLVKSMGIKHFYDMGRNGVLHQIIVERGLVRPGMLLIGSDTHTPTCGGIGAMAIGVNHDLPLLLATGRLWVMVPETIQVRLVGKLRGWANVRDVALQIGLMIGAEEGNYRSVEIDGPGMEAFGVDERLALCNFAPEIGCKCMMAVPNEAIVDYSERRSGQAVTPVYSDPDAQFVKAYELDLSTVRPAVAMPPSPDNAVDAGKVGDVPVDWAFIGSCASGKLNDLRVAAKILEGRKVHPRVKLLVSAASQEIYLQALKEGLIERFIEAGAVVAPPSCGPCYGAMMRLTDDEVCVSTGTRNEPGRMGSRSAKVYIAGPAVVASSAVTGRIVDPEEVMGGDAR